MKEITEYLREIFRRYLIELKSYIPAREELFEFFNESIDLIVKKLVDLTLYIIIYGIIFSPLIICIITIFILG